jgi:hypothetical protein
MAEKKNDPIQQAATEELRKAPSDEDNAGRIAAELTRIRHEMTAIRKILQGRESIEVEELKRLQGRGNIEGGTF